MKYFGSVRFFRHLILTVLALMILVPTTLCIVLAVQNQGYQTQLESIFDSQQPLSAPMESSQLESSAPESSGTESSELSSEPVSSTLESKIPAQVPEYQALYPELYAAPAERGSIDKDKTVYLTFDDGPSALTPKLLKILDQYQVKATFFVIGKEDEQSRAWMKQIVEGGHTLAVHSYTHDYKTIYSSVEEYLADFDKIYKLIYDATGTYPQIFRFPGGSINSYNGAVYQQIVAEMTRRGFVYFDWNTETGDATAPLVKTSTLIKNGLYDLDGLRRSVMLMHDSAPKTTTVDALPTIIEGYRDAGFTFDRLTPEVLPIVYAYPHIK